MILPWKRLFFFGLMKASKCSWGFHGFDEKSLFINEHKQVTALQINDSFHKSALVMKQSLMVLVPNASWRSCHTCLICFWNIFIGWTLQINESCKLSVLNSAQISFMTSLRAEQSVITKFNFQPDKAANILNVVSCKSFKLALVSEKMFNVGNALYFPLLENDCTSD